MSKYSEFLPYIDDSVDVIIDNLDKKLLEKTTFKRRREIAEEMKIYLKKFKEMKLSQPDKIIDDHVGAIILSYEMNPNLDISCRDAHYNGCWYAFWGNMNKKTREEVKAICVRRNPLDQRWTEICLSAIDEYYDTYGIKPKEKLVNRMIKRIKKTGDLISKK